MTTKLYIGSLPYETTDEQLREFLQTIGTVISANVAVDRFAGSLRGFAFVEMATNDDANKAIQELNNRQLGNRTIAVQEARPQERSSSSYDQRGPIGSGGGYPSSRKPW